MIEDDLRLAKMVGEYLGQSGFSVSHAGDGQQGLASLQASSPDLVILDLMLPDMDGLEVCRRIRALPGGLGQTPVLMLTAKGDPMDRIIGLEIGADDYLPKPFEPRELLARIRAVLRRRIEGAPQTGQQLRFGTLDIDRDARTVTVAGLACDLTSYQFDLLVTLAERAGRVLTRDQIMRPCADANWMRLTAQLTCTWAAFAPPSRLMPRTPSAFSRCAAWVMCLRASKTNHVFQEAVCAHLAGGGAGRGGAHAVGGLGLAASCRTPAA